MIKYLIVAFNSLLLFVLSLFQSDSISITANFPKNMMPGSETAIELKIKKGSMGGFAKFQLELPEGFTVSEIDSKGSNFSFSTGIAKWVWPALPSEEEVVLKFKLAVDNASSGSKTVSGKFSYVENNAKQVVEMAPTDIFIGSEQTANSNTAQNTNTTAANTNTQSAAADTTKKTVNTQSTAVNTETASNSGSVTNTNQEPPTNVNLNRTIKNGSANNEYIIDITIKKASIKGFAKYSDDLPAGFTAKSLKNAESSFSVSDGKIKFVWVAIPQADELTISYVLTGKSENEVKLNGEFSYLESDQSKKYIMPIETLKQNSTVATTTLSTETKTETPTTNNTNTLAVNTSTETAANTSNPTETTAKTVNSNAGSINYKVQIGAFTNGAITTQKLARKFSINETIITEMQGGFNKFMIGNHKEYKGAHDQRDNVRSTVKTAFVVAYNGSKRITVQEALMLTNQKWLK